MDDVAPIRRLLVPLTLLLLVAIWLLGGVTVDDTAADECLQLLALPVLLLGAWALLLQGLRGSMQCAGLIVAGLVLLVALVQLMPMPAGWWAQVPFRRLLQADLASAGVQPVLRVGLTRAGAESAVLALVPALALFVAALAVQPAQRRLLVKTILVLVGLNVLFAFFQAGLPPGSSLRLYQDFNAGFGGLLVNTNHQATALIIGMTLAIGQATHAWYRHLAGRGRPLAWTWYAGLALACLLLVPLSTSRAGMVLALPVMMLALFLCSGVRPAAIWRRPSAMLAVVAGLLLASVGVYAALGWVEVDRAEELRAIMARASLAIGSQQAPVGSGNGSFVRVFEQGSPPALWLGSYVNHAHNEYAQWWLETGWPGILVVLAALVLLLAAGWRILRVAGRNGNAILAASCFVAVCAVLLHSVADFPLRTTTLMGTTAVLAGLMLAALDDARRPRPRASHLPAERASPR